MTHLYSAPRITIYEPDGGKVQITLEVISVSRDVEVGWVPRQFAGRIWVEHTKSNAFVRRGWVGDDGMLHTRDELTPEKWAEIKAPYPQLANMID